MHSNISGFENIPVMYHGTTVRLWKKKDDAALFLTYSKSEAQSYADEASESEYEDNLRTKTKVVMITPDKLLKMVQEGGNDIEPDWGWVDAQEHDAKHNHGSFKEGDATWQNSLKACGSIALSDFKHSQKRFFKTVKEELVIGDAFSNK